MRDSSYEPPEFTDEQLNRVLKEVGETARRKAFALGRPVMILRGENLVLLYENGKEEIVDSIHSKDETIQVKDQSNQSKNETLGTA